MTELYISVSTNSHGKRRWRTIYRGMPIMADRPRWQEAVEVYEAEAGADRPVEIPVWDGDMGEWNTLEDVLAAH